MKNEKYSERAFQNVPVLERTSKPREEGLTMLIDWGLGVSAQKDLLDTSGEYIDLAKIAVGIPGLLPRHVLTRKLEIYRENQVEAFPGGQFLEYAVSRDCVKEYLADAREAGFRLIEVSDNTAPFTAAFKKNLIESARNEYGFKVLGEVGSKVKITEIASVLTDVEDCLAAGAWKVFIEAADLIEGDTMRTDLVKALTERFPLEKLIMELPGWWLGPMGMQKPSITNTLLRQLGSNINLGNVEPLDVLYLEAARRKTGVSGFA